MGGMLQEIRLGFRLLVKNPGFATVAVLTLALGIGANTAIFSVINGVLLQPLPLPEPDQLVQLWEVNQKGGQMSVSYLNFHDWRDRTESLASLSYYAGGRTVVLGGSEPIRVPVMQAGRDFFSVAGVQPSLGRAFLPEAARYNGTPEAIISRGFWQRQLGSQENLASLSINIFGFDVPVVGVMPADFDFPTGTDIWIPGNVFPPPPPNIIPLTRTGHNYRVVARLQSDVSLSQAQAEMTTLAQQLQEEHKGMNDAFDVRLVPLQEQLVGQSRTPLLILLGASGLLLLLACANVANLLLARSAARQTEFALRTALGATPGRLVRQLLTESVLVSLLGGGAGLLLGWWVLEFLPLLSPGNLPRLNEISLDILALGFTLIVSLGTGLLFGLAPAFQVSSLNLHSTLKEGGRSSGNARSRKWFRDLLVVSEVALAVVLLIGAGLLISSLQSLLAVNPGFNSENVLTVQISLPAGTYPGTPERSSFQNRLFERMEKVPAIQSAGTINSLPLLGGRQNGTFLFPDRPEEKGYSDYRNVSPDYFSTLNIPLLAGRFFEDSDNTSGPHVAIISQSVKDKYWPAENPLGRTILSIGLDPDVKLWETPITIVGVVGDIHHSGLDQESRPTLYVPYAQRSNFSGFTNLVIRTTGDPLNLVSAVRKEILALDPNVPSDFQTMDAVMARSYSGRRFQMNLFGSFAFIGLLLAAVGIYGVISYSVSRRINEFGIRRALGAQNGDILYLVLRYGLLLAGIGVAVGLAGAYASTQLMASLLYGVTATDTATFGIVSILLLAVALLACYVPARRATKVDPMVALRYE